MAIERRTCAGLSLQCDKGLCSAIVRCLSGSAPPLTAVNGMGGHASAGWTDYCCRGPLCGGEKDEF